MEQPDLELQLKVWKELAISKQVLMQTATKALGLSDECSSQELEDALKRAINETKLVSAKLNETEAKAKADIEALRAKLEASEKANAAIVAAKEEALNAQQAAEQKAASGKAQNAEELKKIKAQLAEKQKEIKQITKVLADTPENVVKKMKGLKKEKMDEANDRKRAEEVSRSLRKEKQKVEQDLTESKALLEKAAELSVSHRELHTLANEQYNLLAEKVEDKASLSIVPAINEELLDAIEAAITDDKEKKDK